MKRLFSAVLALVALTASCVARPTPAAADFGAHCWGKAIIYNGDSLSAINNPIIDFGSVASYGTQIGHNKDCEDKVSAAAAQDPNFNNKTWLCQQIQQRGQFRVSAYAKVGTLNYRVAQSIFVTCSGGVTTCTCPVGWTSNGASQVDGGVTSDGKCKKLACGMNAISPAPPNGTPIGTGPQPWGFTWGNAFVAWGTVANGGAAHCVTSPWVGT